MKNFKVSLLIVMSLGFVLFPGCGTSPGEPPIVEFRGTTMGTTYMIKVVAKGQEDPHSLGVALRADVEQLLKTVNQQMSTWIEDSEISLFNDYRGNEWYDISADTAFVFNEAIRISQISGGAFDVTVGPVIRLWGFGNKKTYDRIPSDQEIKAVLAQIGYRKLSVRLDKPAIKKADPGLYCNLSALAKGFGVDKVGIYLEEKGYDNYVVEIGGEVRAKGAKPGHHPWRIAIATPDGTSNYQRVLELKNISMATSGDYHSYFEKDGVRYSHLIDPNTGRPITHTLASVTVIHSSCMTADAFATAIYIMGPEKGYDLALSEDIPIFMIIRDQGKFIEKMTPSFEPLISGVENKEDKKNKEDKEKNE